MTARARRRLSWLAVAVAAAAGALALVRSIDGWPDAATHLRDDAFYEFTFACNVARGNGPVVSDGVWTSGVQPLWCFLLAWLGNGQARAVADVAIVLGMVCHVVAALSFALAGRGRPASWCAALLWLGNPLLLRECQNGQETALACLCAALLWHGRRCREWPFAALALAAVFARTELWLLVVALALVRRNAGGNGSAKRWWPWFSPVATLGALVAWSLIAGGSVMPDSGQPMAWLTHANFAATGPGRLDWLRQQWWFTRPVLLGNPFALVSVPAWGTLVFVVLQRRWSRSWRWLPLAGVGLLAFIGSRDLWIPLVPAVLLLLVPPPAGAAVPGGRPRELAMLMLGLAAIVALHWAVRWYPRNYYAAPLMVGAAAAVVAARRWPWLLLALAGAGLVVPRLEPEPLRHQRAMQVAAAVAPVVLPANERVGSFNAGILAFSRLEQRPPTVATVNLDGVVDRRAFRALRQRRLGEWLDDQGIRFLVDEPFQFTLDPTVPHASGTRFGGDFDPDRDLVELVRCVEPGVDAGRPGTAWVGIYWRRGRGTPVLAPTTAQQLIDLPDGSAVVVWPAQNGEVLEVETAVGERQVLWTATVSGCHALAVAKALRRHGRLFVRGRESPLLVLRQP